MGVHYNVLSIFALLGLSMRKRTKKSIKKNCDKLFSQSVRSVGYCELAGLDHIQCNGVLQCMHIRSRSNHRLRWNFTNALCGCQAHHYYYTHHNDEWKDLIEDHFPKRNIYLKEENKKGSIDRSLSDYLDLEKKLRDVKNGDEYMWLFC